ncbi:MFS general substrate transporter [Pseudovirgaria hyperparasitica]|uniref:MFS general substrate transporter n=1 Tax=Pseudovirgaria hyperparasitica TaxID=470096 RepID=A0A6A6W757_9PEZI|nr:MFS general substrate transporter [Pseudovirgaria hyperparasitica]KAF2758463.1 MFS general substrate transporter [Pseudovirgaria hyperparasitica]
MATEANSLTEGASSGKGDNPPDEHTAITTPPNEQTKPNRGGPVRWSLVVTSLLISIFLFALDNTVVADVQPSIIESLHNVDKLPWVSVAFPLGAIAMTLPVARLASLYDNKLIFINGVLLFEIGSAVCGAAPNMTALIIGRVLCGMGGVAIYSGAMNLLSVLTSEAERPMYLNLTGLTWGAGTVLGPIVGGAFAESSATWRWAFYINLCVGGAFAPVFIFMIPSFTPRPGEGVFAKMREIDWLGATLNAGALVSFVMAVSFGGGVYAWSSAQIIALWCVSGVLWILFVLQQAFAITTTKVNRIFPVKLIKDYENVIFFMEIAAATTVVYIPLYYIPIFFQFVHNDSPLEAGVRLLPLVAFQVFGVILCGSLSNAVGYYFPWYIVGGALGVIGGGLFYSIGIDTSAAAVYGYSVILGLAAMYVQCSFSVVQLKSTPREIPDAVALISLGQIAGVTAALTISSSVFLNQASGRIAEAFPQFARSQVVGAITGARGEFIQMLTEAQRRRVLEIIVDVISRLYGMVIAAGGFSIVLAVFMRREKLFFAAPKPADEESGPKEKENVHAEVKSIVHDAELARDDESKKSQN